MQRFLFDFSRVMAGGVVFAPLLQPTRANDKPARPLRLSCYFSPLDAGVTCLLAALLSFAEALFFSRSANEFGV